MSPQTKRRGRARAAATTVEVSVVISVCLLFLFGVLEYGRYVMMLQLVDNACREGSRYAAVSTNTAVTSDVQNVVVNYLAGQSVQLKAPDGVSPFDPTQHIQVFKADTTTAQPLDANNNVVSPWTNAPFNNTQFGQGIAVKITASYHPILPSFLFMNRSLPMNGQTIVFSEAN